jgi:hypothetical protein
MGSSNNEYATAVISQKLATLSNKTTSILT